MGRIVGADILGHDAGELIAPFVLAVAKGMSVKDFATAVFPYPTRAEAARRAAIAFYAPKLEFAAAAAADPFPAEVRMSTRPAGKRQRAPARMAWARGEGRR